MGQKQKTQLPYFEKVQHLKEKSLVKASQEVRPCQVILHFASTLLTLKVILEHKYDTE